MSGQFRRHQPTEALEPRRLLSAQLSAGVLTVTGTAGSDVLALRTLNSDLRVVINDQLTKFNTASVTSIKIDLGDGNDRLDVALAMPVYVLGGLGNDTINGGSGNDTVTAGGGKDSVDGGSGNDRIDGGPTADFLFGNDGADRIYGSDANDTLVGGAGVDRLFGGNGNDNLSGGASNDKLYGDAGDDLLSGNNQNDLLTGGIGNDTILGGDGNDTLNGQDGNDSLLGQGDYDTLYGDAGFDTLDGGAASDSLTGGDDADSMIGSDGDDTLIGNAGNDTMWGDAGKDYMDGGDGDDSMAGGYGTDALLGGPGNDGLLGGRDEDTLTGNAGADRFLMRANDVITDRVTEDARVNFADGNLVWDDEQISQLDLGMQFLVARTHNTKLLKLSSGKDITVYRYNDVGTDVLGDNYDNGRIDIADLTFDPTVGVAPGAVLVHELGHDWDSEDENPTARTFFELSRWRERNGVWTYDPNAQFAIDYGRTNPQEDFATAFEVYYSQETPASLWQAKWNYIDGFLNSMTTK